jgi:hypothetical protein
MALQSPFANLYESVMARIKEKVPAIKYIDQDMGQLENYGLRPAVGFPCLLIDTDEFEFSEQGNDSRQLGDGFIIIRMGVPAWSSSSGFTPAAIREKALQYYEIENEIFKALHRWSPDGFNRLLRRKVRTEKRDDEIRVRIIAFQVLYTDESAVKNKTLAPKPDANIGINR